MLCTKKLRKKLQGSNELVLNNLGEILCAEGNTARRKSKIFGVSKTAFAISKSRKMIKESLVVYSM